MIMGDFYPTMALEAERRHVRQEKKRLQALAAQGPKGLQEEIRHFERREARLLAEMADEEQVLEQTYKNYDHENH